MNLMSMTKSQKQWLKFAFQPLMRAADPSKSNWSTTDFVNNVNATGIPIYIASTADLQSVWQAAQEITSELTHNQFKNLNFQIKLLSHYLGWKDSTGHPNFIGDLEVADAIAQLALASNIQWDASNYTQYEVNYFNNTLLGNALLKYNPSQQTSNTTGATSTPKQKNNPFPNTVVAGNYVKAQSVHLRSTKTKTPGVVNNSYKQSGPQSKNAFDLKSTPGQKVKLHGEQGYIFVITAKDTRTSKNRPFAYINPLINTATYRNTTTNIVKFSSAHGYSDLPLYFNTQAEAEAFLQKMIAANRIPLKLVSPVIGIRSLQSNKGFSHDFYEIGTEFGNAFVCAYKLNENLN